MSAAALPLPRLTAVELRKMVDTRAGLWLQAATAALMALAVIAVVVLGETEDHTLWAMLQVAILPAAILLPVAGILLVSSEWSQRTTLITFTLVPRRHRVIVAKVCAGVVLALAALAVSLGAAALGTAAAGGAWNLSAGLAGQAALYLVATMLMGVAFGAALLSSAPAIVLYFALPIAWGALTALVPGLDGVAHWLEIGQATDPLVDHLASAREWAHLGTALALWLGVPLAIGAWRVLRGELK